LRHLDVPFDAVVTAEDCGSYKPSPANFRRLLEEFGVAALSGASFGEHGEGYLRLSYANSEENLRKALDRIEAAALATVATR
jgi:aspartate/methionine/tyrosine aminotransferase